MVVLIPAYEPDGRLVDLVRRITAERPDLGILVVDDGSGPGFAPVFAAVRSLGADVVAHPVNRGKGAALKTGFAEATERFPGQDVVCADCDGQHTLTDVLRVAAAVREHPGTMVLGARLFVGDVPTRSRFGNDVTRAVFRMATGLHLQDTQTGLRAYPAPMLPWLQTVPGDRFEYELELLLSAERTGVPMLEIPIETVYLAGNESSHFRSVRDSVRVYLPFLKFSLSSITAFAVDAALFFAVFAATRHLLAAVVAARAVSATVNFIGNRRIVFRDGVRGARSAALRYASLVVTLMAANYGLLHAMTDGAGLPVVVAKVLTEALLFTASYHLQRRYVFAAPRAARTVMAAQVPAPVSAGRG